jgi:hypothetical protein
VLGLAASAYTGGPGGKAVDADGRRYGALDPHPIPLLVVLPGELAGAPALTKRLALYETAS